MSLKVLYPIKYAQAEEESSLNQRWKIQKQQEEEQAQEEARRHQFTPMTPGSHRGIGIAQDEDELSLPLGLYPSVLSDADKAKINMYQATTRPSKYGGPETEHFTKTIQDLRAMGVEPIKMGGENIPERYQILFPDPLDFILESKGAGRAGWISDVLGAAVKKHKGNAEDAPPIYAYIHPSLLPKDAGFSPEEMRSFAEANPQNNAAAISLFLMGMVNHYLSVGNDLRNNPELNDEEYILKEFWVKFLGAKTPNGKPIFLNRENPYDPSTIYGYLYYFAKSALKRILDKYSTNKTGDIEMLEGGDQSFTINDAIDEAINNTIRKILSGFFNKKAHTDNPALYGKFLFGFAKNSIEGEMKSYFSNRFKNEEKTESDITVLPSDNHSRDLADFTASDINVADEVIEQFEKDILSDEEDETDESTGTNVRAKQNLARNFILNNIKQEAMNLGMPDILDQWNLQFQDFLVNHKTYLPEPIIDALPNLLQVIDFNHGILPDNAYPCPKCGKTFVENEDGKIDPAVVFVKKGTFQCRNCRETYSRASDMANALTIPLLAFFEAKKKEYFANQELELEDKVSMIENIERLMSLNKVRLIGKGPTRYGQSFPGREPVFIYKNGKLFLKNARAFMPKESNDPNDLDFSKMLVHAELEGLPLSRFFAGLDYPLGGFDVGHDRRGDKIRPPFGKSGLINITPGISEERNTIIQQMIGLELLPLLVREPKIQEMFGGLTPVELLSSDTIKSNLKTGYLAPLMHEILGALNNIHKRVKIQFPEEEIKSYSDLLQKADDTLINETIYQLSRKYNSLIPGENVPLPANEIAHLIQRAVYALDTIASLDDASINDLSMSQLLQEDPAAKTDPWYHATANYSQFDQSKKKSPSSISDISNILGKPEARNEELEIMEDQVQRIMSFVESKEEDLKSVGLKLPQSPKDKDAITALSAFLIENGIEELGVSPAEIKSALTRIGIMYENTQNIYRAFKTNELPSPENMVDLSQILSDKAADRIILTLMDKGQMKFPNAYATIEASPLIRMVFYMSSIEASFSISDFLQMLLVSSSGMFGIAEQYETPKEYFEDYNGQQIRSLPLTEDQGKRDKLPSFNTAVRENVPGGYHPRYVTMPRTKDPYSEKEKSEIYMLFADQFSSEAIANNPRYSYYIQELSKMEQFQGMTPVDIVENLKQEITNFVKNLYLEPEGELFKNDPITSMWAIASFFVPSDLIDVCLDAWAKNMLHAPIEERRKGQVQNGFYQASSILFDIKEMLNNSEANIEMQIMKKYNLADDPEDTEWEEYVFQLLKRIIRDIYTEKGCASRALEVIGNKNNLKYLSSSYKPSPRNILQNKSAKILRNVNALIRLASKHQNIQKDLYELQSLINEELYAEI